MLKFDSHMIGVDGGQIVLFSDFQTDGEMWTGDGPRHLNRRIEFSEQFIMPPQVLAYISMWDIDSGTNARADIQTDEVDVTGFLLVFRTWGDTRIARIRVGWQAIGPVGHPENWDLY